MTIVVPDDSRFPVELANAGTKLVVVDFTAGWCTPCHQIAPLFDELSVRYPSVVFLKVDVDQCHEVAAAQAITVMPTFMFYRNKVKLCQVQGADPQALEAKIKELAGCSGDEDNETGVKGHLDLHPFINKSCSECLNDSDSHPFSACLTSENGYLESDCDEQLIMSFGFTQTVKLHSLKILAPEGNGPKILKMFINQPHTLDFDQADSMEAVQTVEVTPEDLTLGRPIPLRYVKYQNVQNLQIFIVENQGQSEVTRIDHLILIGSPVLMTNMGEFKRVSGKKGESH